MDDSYKSSDTESDRDSKDGTLVRKILYAFKRRCCVIEGDFSILACFYCVMLEVRKDMADRNSRIRQNAPERAITNIFLYKVNANMGQVISELWAE